MAHVYFSKVLNASPDQVWRIVGDFASLPVWFPFVERSELRDGGPREVGAIRVNTLTDGKVVEEKLMELSDRERRVVYAVLSGDVPVANYSAALRIGEVIADPDRCFAEWSADFDVVDGDLDAVSGWVRTGIFETCLDELERVLRAEVGASSSRRDEAAKNRDLVRRAFDGWAAGGTEVVDLLDENVEWTIAGSGRSAQTFHGRQAFLDDGYGPIIRRFTSGMRPHVIGLHADGDEVIVRWDGTATMQDGQTYRNSYAWFFRMRGGKVVEATAFLDLPTYDAALDGTRLPVRPAAA